MAAKIASLAVLLFVVLQLAGSSSVSTQAAAQGGGNCAQVLAEQKRALEAVGRQLKAEALEFLRDDAVSAALDAVQPLASDYPTEVAALNAARTLKRAKDSVESWEATCKRYDATFQDLMKCLNLNGTGQQYQCIRNYSDRVRGAFKKWLDTTFSGDLPAGAAIERVRRAAGIVRNAASQIAGVGTASAMAASKCLGDAQQVAERRAVELRNAAPRRLLLPIRRHPLRRAAAVKALPLQRRPHRRAGAGRAWAPTSCTAAQASLQRGSRTASSRRRTRTTRRIVPRRKRRR